MKRFLSNESGQGVVEYGLIIALIVMVVIVGLTVLGTKASDFFTGVSDILTIG